MMETPYIIMIVAAIFLLAIIVIYFYFKSDTGKALVLMYMMKKHGRDSFWTINILQDLVKRTLSKEFGAEVTDCSLVHEVENRYHAIITVGGETKELTIFADITGTIHYRIEN